jgi:hypothetical protein
MTGYDYYQETADENTDNAVTDDAANSNNEEGDTDEQWWDDYLANNNANRYNGYNNNDDAANGDDYYANNNNNGDDANNSNNNNGDDANNNKNGDDYYYQNNNNNGDDGNNDDAAAADDYYAGDDYYGGGRQFRWLYTPPQQQQAAFTRRSHMPRGICKLRDYQEQIWDPIAKAIATEWKNGKWNDEQRPRRRRTEDYVAYDDAYAAATDDQYAAAADDQYAAAADDDQYATYTDDQYAAYTNDTSGSDQQQQQQQGGFVQRDLAADVRIALFFAFLIFLGVLGRRRRMRTRFYVVRARAQEDHLYYASSDQAAARRVAFDDTKEDQYEGACSHTLCGCYPVDEVEDNGGTEQVEVTDNGIFRRKVQPHHEDSVARSFNCLMAVCCGAVCKCWFQCLSICAVAQEAREIRLLLPPRYQRIDYITHQPFHEYQKAVNNLRRGWLGRSERMVGIMPHYNALSRLSRYIVMTFLITTLALVGTLVFNKRAAFSWQDAVVLFATFLQSFFVHWIFHKSDLSLDAVIKFFAAGFLVAVPTSVFFEGLLVNLVLFGGWAMYYAGELIGGEDLSNFVFDHWRIIWIIGELFNAYVVAAITEELCKYYTFRAVEHPDLVFLTGLQREEKDEKAVDGGLVKYPFASHQVQEFIKDSPKQSPRKNKRTPDPDQLIQRTGTTDAEFDEDDSDVRTYRQKGMAITTGMISVAVGLACAENFLYVFLLGGALGGTDNGEENHPTDVMEAWIVLFFRSIFPVHALAAAMQSINMIRKFVEHDGDAGHRIGVGRIIVPAILLHGTFDAILMGINVYVETAWDKYLEENEGNIGDEDPYNSFIVNLVAWISITVTMFFGLIWYYRQYRSQRLRLILLEEKDKALVGVAGSTMSSWPSTNKKSKDVPDMEYA